MFYYVVGNTSIVGKTGIVCNVCIVGIVGIAGICNEIRGWCPNPIWYRDDVADGFT